MNRFLSVMIAASLSWLIATAVYLILTLPMEWSEWGAFTNAANKVIIRCLRPRHLCRCHLHCWAVHELPPPRCSIGYGRCLHCALHADFWRYECKQLARLATSLSPLDNRRKYAFHLLRRLFVSLRVTGSTLIPRSCLDT